jgi:hypothetical protein
MCLASVIRTPIIACAPTELKGCVRGCNGFLRSTMNLYINKEEKTKERRESLSLQTYINIISLNCCPGNISYDSTGKEKKSQVP